MKTTLTTRNALAAVAALTFVGSANAATILFELGSGDTSALAGDNTSYLSNASSGFNNPVANGTTLSDDTQSSGLIATFSAGTGQELRIQGLNDVGIGTDNNGDNYSFGDVIEVTFNQPVTLNSIWINSGGNDRSTNVTPIINTTTLAGQTATTSGGSSVATELVWDDTTVLQAGQVLSITHADSTTNDSVGVLGIEVAIVPEPGSLALLGLGGLLVASRRRRA